MGDSLADIEAIKQLKYRYFRTLDLRLWDEFAECLIPEVVGDYGDRHFDDRDSLVDCMRENMNDGLVSMHQAQHPEIEV